MRTILTPRYFICLLTLTMLLACSDHRIPAVSPGSSATRLRVKTITQTIGLHNNQLKISSFGYDTQGRLSSILAFQIPDSSAGAVERNTYQYDAQNRLIQHQRIITRPLFFKGTIERHQFSYNTAGQLAEITYFNDTDLPGSPILTFTASPQFTASNKLQSNQKLLNPTFIRGPFSDVRLRGDFLLSNIIYTGDNLTAYHSQRIGNDVGSFISITDSDQKLTYDTKINPFYGLYVIPIPVGSIIDVRNNGYFNQSYYGGLDNLFNLSRNNVLSVETSNAPSLTTYEYTYNAADLPISRTTRSSFSNFIVEKISLDYESY